MRSRLLVALLVTALWGCGGESGVVTPKVADAGRVDAGRVDGGAHDAGPLDSGAVDAGALDAGPADAGTPDAGLLDAGPADAGVVDAGPVDAGPADSGAPDAGVVDAGPEDAGPVVVDAGPEDAGFVEVDAGEPDAGFVEVDAGEPDAGPPDAGTPDAGPAPLRPFDVVGFGEATQGGWQPGFVTVHVTSLDDSGPGTLREALDQSGGNPTVVVFDLDGTIALQAPLLVPSNLSIDGRGRRVVLQGKGLILVGSDDVILTNFAIEDVQPNSEDGIRIGDPAGPSERVVVDHVRFSAHNGNGDSKKVDEAISVVFGSRDITLAWLRFEDWEKGMLFGNGDAPQAVDGQISVTVHHCYAHATGRRHPQARYGRYDFFDNFWDDWRMYGWFFQSPYPEAFGMQAQDSARMRAENNLFRRSSHTYDVGSQANDATRCESGGVIEESGSTVVAGGNAALSFGVGCIAGTPSFPRPYLVTVDPPDATLLNRLLTETGNTL